MGFMNALKGANNNWGLCTSNFFKGMNYLGPKNLLNHSAQELMISGGTLKEEFVFTKNDVASCKVMANGQTWIWFHIAFKDGKSVQFLFSKVISTRNGSVNGKLLEFIRCVGL